MPFMRLKEVVEIDMYFQKKVRLLMLIELTNKVIWGNDL